MMVTHLTGLLAAMKLCKSLNVAISGIHELLHAEGLAGLCLVHRRKHSCLLQTHDVVLSCCINQDWSSSSEQSHAAHSQLGRQLSRTAWLLHPPGLDSFLKTDSCCLFAVRTSARAACLVLLGAGSGQC